MSIYICKTYGPGPLEILHEGKIVAWADADEDGAGVSLNVHIKTNDPSKITVGRNVENALIKKFKVRKENA